MSEKGDNDRKFIVAVTSHIKGACSPRDLFMRIYNKSPSRDELQQFTNRLNPNRSNPNTKMLGICIKHLPQLHQMTLKEFFDIGN